MSSIDDRIVNMKFNNDQFKKGVADTTKSLADLKKGLNLDGAAKSLEGLDAAGKKFSLASIADGVQSVASKFTALSVVGITALTNIANRAIDTGLQMAKALTIDPIKSGLEEYETNLNAIQTILANTQASGSTLTDVNKTLAELNTYSDQTIYNFAEMAKNIGTFTAAGVNLDTSAKSIKGIANLAALSGSNSQQASTAMYQLSQAISSGKVSLQDWNSVVNAGMGGTVFQRALAETAVKMGKLDSSAVSLEGDMKNVKISGESFRDSISAAGGGSTWLSSDVLTSTLAQFTGDLTDAELAAQGFTDAQIEAIQATAKTAKQAATVVKTSTQLLDTLKESAGSGWAQTWQIIFGDFEEAKQLWTGVNNVLGEMIGNSSDARNNLLQDWKSLGGRDLAIESVKNAFEALMGVFKPIKEAFSEIFPAATGQQLVDITRAIRDFTLTLKMGEGDAANLKRTFRGLFAVLDIGWMIIKGILGVIGKLFGSLKGGGDNVLTITGRFGDFLLHMRNVLKNGDGLTKFFDGLAIALQKPIDFLKKLVGYVRDFVSGFKGFDTSNLGNIGEGLEQRLAGLESFGEKIKELGRGIKDWLRGVPDALKPMGDAIRDFFNNISSGIGGFDPSKLLDIISVGLFGGLVLLVRKFMKNGIDIDLTGGFLESITDAFGGLTDTLGAMQNTLKAGTLMLLAAAIALLTVSVIGLTTVDQDKLAGALGAMAVMFGQLMIAMSVFGQIAIGTSVIKMTILGGAMILLSAAILILVQAVKQLSELDWAELNKGLFGVMGVILALAGAAKLMPANNARMISTGLGMIAIAVAVKILASAVKDFSSLSWDEIGRGLTGVGTVLGALAIFTRMAKVSKGSFTSAAGIILLGVALKIMASATKDFANIDPNTLEQGLGSIGGIFAVVAAFSRVVNPAGMVTAAISMTILGGALKIFASAVQDLGSMSWETLNKGLIVIAGALVGIGVAMRLMPKGMLISAAALVVVAASLKILASVLQDFGGMDMNTIGKSFIVLGGSLLIIGLAMAGMTAALPGAAALLVVSFALSMLAPVLISLGNMSWEAIGKGLTMLAASIAVIALAGLLLTPVIPSLFGLGAAMLLLGAGAALLGVGLVAAGAGLAAIAAAGSAAVPVLIELIGALLTMIPIAAKQLALGIVAFVQTLAESTPAFVNSLNDILKALMQLIRDNIPTIVAILFELIMALVNEIANNVPKFVDAGGRMIAGVLQGIANNMGAIIDAGVNIIVEFLNGINRNMQRVTDAAADTVITFVNSIANTINGKRGEMEAAGQNLGWAIADGMTGGMASKVRGIIDGAINLGKQAVAAIKNAIDSNSPSKETHKLGGYFGDGFIVGIDSKEAGAVKSASKVGNAAMDALKESMEKATAPALDGLDMSPVVRPVLDLSSFRKDATLANGLLNRPVLDIGTTSSRATTVAVGERERYNSEVTKSEAVPETGTTMTFIQNNNSPKALSRAEIYRQTNNQLSVVKGRKK